jgi:hypothetical protein
MIGSGTHDCSIEDADFQKNAEYWDAWLTQEAAIYHEFHDYWCKQPMPMHIVRYEDLKDPVLKPQVLTEMMKFLLMVPSIEGTYIESVIQKVCQSEGPQVYKPRSGKVNANMKFFSQEQL